MESGSSPATSAGRLGGCGLGLTPADLECPICLSLLQDPFVTACGHSFCYGCISMHVQSNKNCPCCAHFVSKDHLFPNFLLSKVVSKAAPLVACSSGSPFDTLLASIVDEKVAVSAYEIDTLLAALRDKKRALEASESQTNAELLLHFLQYSRGEKAKRLQQLHDELHCLEHDIGVVHTRQLASANAARGKAPAGLLEGLPALDGAGAQDSAGAGSRAHAMVASLLKAARGEGELACSASPAADAAGAGSPAGLAAAPDLQCGGVCGGSRCGSGALAKLSAAAAASYVSPRDGTSTAGSSRGPDGAPSACGTDDCDGGESAAPSNVAKRRRIASQFEELQNCYLSLRARPVDVQLCLGGAEAGGGGGGGGEDEEMVGAVVADEGLHQFSRLLSVFTNSSTLEVVGAVRAAHSRHATSILSSIEFDRDGTVFATGGVCKRITLYDFGRIVDTPGTDVHPPVHEIATRSKLTSLSWNHYVRPHLISSDYEGVVALWDVSADTMLSEYEAHEKRIWSVDFCRTDPMTFVSGSDDGWVKVWSTRQANSVLDLHVKANVCCVEYNPRDAHQLAVGSADHHVHVYDLRHTARPLHLFSGHRKAVSYVRYMSPCELATASTDGTLRLWDLQTAGLQRTFTGHANEKNFVGMTCNEEFLACGSESNEVHVYLKQLGAPIAKRAFDAPPAGGAARDGQFISAVTWQPGTRTLVAANCHGFIKIMRLSG